MQHEVVKLAKEKNKTIASCESLTAGLFSATIASVPGASSVLKGGLVTYFTSMKTVLAHVDEELIDKYGVVSKECAHAMATNTRKIMDVDYAISFTGNAGPSTMENKPAGRVYCGLSKKDKTDVYEFQFNDMSRNEVREAVVQKMLKHLFEALEKE